MFRGITLLEEMITGPCRDLLPDRSKPLEQAGRERTHVPERIGPGRPQQMEFGGGRQAISSRRDSGQVTGSRADARDRFLGLNRPPPRNIGAPGSKLTRSFTEARIGWLAASQRRGLDSIDEGHHRRQRRGSNRSPSHPKYPNGGRSPRSIALMVGRPMWAKTRRPIRRSFATRLTARAAA
jgi:hypothetical protein